MLHPAGAPHVLLAVSSFPSLQVVQFLAVIAHVRQFGSHKKHWPFESSWAGATQAVQAGLPSAP
jgi:hypothetical protein